MYGPHVNKLNIYIQYPHTALTVPIWSKYGSHGNIWHSAQVWMGAKGTYQVFLFLTYFIDTVILLYLHIICNLMHTFIFSMRLKQQVVRVTLVILQLMMFQ